MLWVKGSGTDLATIAPAGFAALRLDELLPLRGREAMDDAEMVDYLRRSALAPDQPRPSIETLLHAFVPATHVDHTHPDAVIALTSVAGRPPARRGGVRRRGGVARLPAARASTCRSRIAELLEANPARARGPARPARARHLGRDERRDLPRHARVRRRAARRRSPGAGNGRLGLGGAAVRAARRGRGGRAARGRAAGAARRAPRRRRRASSSRSTGAPEAVAFASSRAGARR